MFGERKHLANKLAKTDGVRAQAEVTAAKQGNVVSSRQGVAALATTNWKVSVIVRPDGQEPFPATIEMRVGVAGTVMVGTMVSVIFDPDDHSKVAHDGTEDGVVGAITEQLANFGGRHGNQADISSMLKSVVKNPSSLDPMALAEAMGMPTDQARGGVIDLRGGGSAESPAPTATDPVAQLTQLADLRDRGVLSPEEFEAQKQRILAQE